MTRSTLPALTLALALLAAAPAFADQPGPLPPGCDDFGWDVSHELATLSQPTQAITAGDGSADGAGRIALDTAYTARLLPQAGVTLAAPPGRPTRGDDAHAGLLTFQVPADGRYRVTITTGHWIDVVDDGRIIRSLDFQGRHGCPLVRKIVEFELPAGRDLVLQFAGHGAGESGVLITPAASPLP